MNEAEAVAIADQARSVHNVPLHFIPVAVKKKIIELVDSDQASVEETPGPGPVRDVVAWLVTFGESAEGAELAIDDKTGKVVRVLRTAGSYAVHPENGD